MTVYLGHRCAYWILAQQGAKLKGVARNRQLLPELLDAEAGARTARRVRAALSAQGIVLGSDVTLEFLVAKPGQRRRAKGTISRVFGQPIPERSLLEIAPDIYIFSPEFVFLQLAHEIRDLHELIKFGSELCSLFRTDSSEAGFHASFPMTTPALIDERLKPCKGAHGIKRVRQALRYIAAGARSPMESALFMMLSMPRVLGGYGIDRPEVNYSVELSSSARKIAGQKRCLLDFAWKKHKFALEYMGQAYHQNMGKDEARRTALEHDGWTVKNLFSPQVLKRIQREELVSVLLKITGKRLYATTEKMRQMQNRLLSCLFPSQKDDGWERPSWALPDFALQP